MDNIVIVGIHITIDGDTITKCTEGTVLVGNTYCLSFPDSPEVSSTAAPEPARKNVCGIKNSMTGTMGKGATFSVQIGDDEEVSFRNPPKQENKNPGIPVAIGDKICISRLGSIIAKDGASVEWISPIETRSVVSIKSHSNSTISLAGFEFNAVIAGILHSSSVELAMCDVKRHLTVKDCGTMSTFVAKMNNPLPYFNVTCFGSSFVEADKVVKAAVSLNTASTCIIKNAVDVAYYLETASNFFCCGKLVSAGSKFNDEAVQGSYSFSE